MTSLNVYRHFNLSIQEIFLQGDMVALPAVDVPEAKKEKAEEASFFKPFAFAALFFASLAGVAIYISNPFEKRVVVVEPPPPALPEEEPDLYVRIQVIEFADEQTALVESIPAESAEPLVSSRTPERTETPQKPPAAVAKPQGARRLSPPVPNLAPLPTQGPFYALSLAGASERDVAGLYEAANGFVGVTVTREVSPKVWRVYVPTQNSATLVDGIPVISVGRYAAREEAEKAARDLGQGTYYIRQEEQAGSFNVSVCCADLETAKYIAAASGITDKVIKVIKQ